MTPAPAQTGNGSQLDLILAGRSVVGLGDGPLLDRVAAGDGPSAGAALDALIRRHGALVARVCRGILGDAQLAEDATQAVFLVLIRRGGSIRDPDRLAPWLHGVALRTARAARRQHRRSLPSPISLDETTMIDPTLDPAQSLIRRERAELLHAAINRLPRRYLDPVVLCDLVGLTHAEAAQRLDCPPSTVGVRLKRAREKLRATLSRHRLDFETALPPAVGLSSIPRTLAATPAAHFLANRVAWTLAAAKWQALAVVLLLTGVATVGVRAGYQSPAPAVVPPNTDPPPRQDPPRAPATPQPAPADYPAWIKLGVPEVREVADQMKSIGTLAELRVAEIRAPVSGTIGTKFVAEGDPVEEELTLFKIREAPDSPRLIDHEREQKLDRQRLAFLVAEVDRIRADPQAQPKDLWNAEMKLQQSAVTSKKADSQFFVEQEGRAGVLMPFAGVIAHCPLEEGATVEAGKTVLATIMAIDPIQVNFQVDERNYLKIQRWIRSHPDMTYLPVQVALVDEKTYDHPGRVLFRAVRFTHSGDGSLCTLHAELPNPDKTMIPGMTARVRIEYGEPRRATLIPADAYWNSTNDANNATVWVVDANRIAHQRNLRIGTVADDFTEVLGGLDPQERIILNGGPMDGHIPGFGIVDGQPLPPPDTKQPEVPTGPGFQ